MSFFKVGDAVEQGEDRYSNESSGDKAMPVSLIAK